MIDYIRHFEGDVTNSLSRATDTPYLDCIKSQIDSCVIQRKEDIMLIGEKYKLESDVLNITLSIKAGRKGKEQWRNIAYFSDPKEALNYLVQHEIRGTGFTDLETIVKKQDELYQLIQAIPDEVLPQLIK